METEKGSQADWVECEKGRQYVRCEVCGTPVAEEVNGEIVIVARHHGERHVTRVGNRETRETRNERK